jgi:hypothetical protein
MSADPNVKAFLIATAFLTAFFFAIGVYIPALLLLRWLLF